MHFKIATPLVFLLAAALAVSAKKGRLLANVGSPKPGCVNLVSSLDQAPDNIRLNPMAGIFRRLCDIRTQQLQTKPNGNGRAAARLRQKNLPLANPFGKPGGAGIFDPNLLTNLLGGFQKLVTGAFGGNSLCYERGDATHEATKLDIIFRGLTEEEGVGDISGESCLTNNVYNAPLCLSTGRNAKQMHETLRDYLIDCDATTMRLRINSNLNDPDRVGCPVRASAGSEIVWKNNWQIEANEGDTLDVSDEVAQTYPCGANFVEINSARLRIARSMCMTTRQMLRSRCDITRLSVLSESGKRNLIEECALNNVANMNGADFVAEIEKCMCVEMAPYKGIHETCNANQENSPKCIMTGFRTTEERYQTDYLVGCLDRVDSKTRSGGNELSCLVQKEITNDDATAESFRNAVLNCDQNVLKLFVDKSDSCVYHVPGPTGSAWSQTGGLRVVLTDEERERATRINSMGFPCNPLANEKALERVRVANKKALNVFKTSCRMLVDMLSDSPGETGPSCQSLCRLKALAAINPDIYFKKAAPGKRPLRLIKQGSNAFLTEDEVRAKKIVTCAKNRMAEPSSNAEELLNPDVTSSCFAREVPPQC